MLDNFEHEGNSNLKFMIKFWVIKILHCHPILYCINRHLSKTEIGNPPEQLHKIPSLKLKTSTAKNIYDIKYDIKIDLDRKNLSKVCKNDVFILTLNRPLEMIKNIATGN